jgi:hypothetical protein
MGTYFIYLSSLGFDVKGSLTEPQDSKPKSAIFAHAPCKPTPFYDILVHLHLNPRIDPRLTKLP